MFCFRKEQLGMSVRSNPLDVILDEDEEETQETLKGESGEGEHGSVEEEGENLSGDVTPSNE